MPRSSRFVARWLFTLTIALVSAMGVLDSARQRVSLPDVLQSAGRYVRNYVDTFSNVVAEEEYVQRIVWLGRVLPVDANNPSHVTVPGQNTRRTLRSDLVLVKVGPPLEWRPYRDVFEVDGKAVRDRDDRLTQLFLQPGVSTEARALRIAQESARFNLSSVGRTLNGPGLALAFLQADLQPRFEFSLDGREGADVIVRFKETARPTLFRHNNTLDNPSSGRFWIDAASGLITKVEHVMSPEDIEVKVTTTFREDREYGIAVPTEMDEQIYLGNGAAYKLVGHATYSRFRQFQVSTEAGPMRTR